MSACVANTDGRDCHERGRRSTKQRKKKEGIVSARIGIGLTEDGADGTGLPSLSAKLKRGAERNLLLTCASLCTSTFLCRMKIRHTAPIVSCSPSCNSLTYSF